MKLHIVFLAFFVLIVSCDSNISSENPAADQMKGNIIGYVTYYDTVYTDFVSNDRRKILSGAAVQVEGTPFSAVSDSNGRWEIHGLPAGTYSVTCSKEGYATVK